MWHGVVLRGSVIGRVNHFGSRYRRGTEAAAILYSLLESAKRASVEPAAYLDLAARAALNGGRLGRNCATPRSGVGRGLTLFSALDRH
jgi:hypothetical protein